MKKNILSVLLCGIIILGVTSCGEKNTSSDTDNTNNNSQETPKNTIKTISCEELTDESNISNKYEGFVFKYDESKKELIEYKMYRKMVFSNDTAMNEEQKDIFINRISLCNASELLYGDTVKSCDSNRNGNTVLSELYFDLDKLSSEDSKITKESTIEEIESYLKQELGSSYNSACKTN